MHIYIRTYDRGTAQCGCSPPPPPALYARTSATADPLRLHLPPRLRLHAAPVRGEARGAQDGAHGGAQGTASVGDVDSYTALLLERATKLRPRGQAQMPISSRSMTKQAAFEKASEAEMPISMPSREGDAGGVPGLASGAQCVPPLVEQVCYLRYYTHTETHMHSCIHAYCTPLVEQVCYLGIGFAVG